MQKRCEAAGCRELLEGMRADAQYCSNTCRQRADRQRRREQRPNSSPVGRDELPPGSLLAAAWVALQRIASEYSIDLTGQERRDIERAQQLVRVRGIHAVGDDLNTTELKRWESAIKWAQEYVADLSP